MSNTEPGVNLARMIAAERNALAAIQVAKQQEEALAEMRQKVSRLEALVVQQSQRIDEANRNAALARAL